MKRRTKTPKRITPHDILNKISISKLRAAYGKEIAAQIADHRKQQTMILSRLKEAALEYGRHQESGRGTLFNPGLPALAAAAVVFFKMSQQGRKRVFRAHDLPE